MWGNPVERVAALRKRHKVWPSALAVGSRCHQDGVRIYPIKGGWRHDTPEVVALNAEASAYREPVTA